MARKTATQIDMLGNRITNLGTPSESLDAVTKEYVDDAIADIDTSVTVDSSLSSSSTSPVQNKVITSALNGKAASSHTHESGDISIPWQGEPSDIDCIKQALCANAGGVNRLALLPASQIVIEETTNGGTTWASSNYSDSIKRALFTGKDEAISIGIPLKNGVRSIDCAVRITITAFEYDVPSGTAEGDKPNYWTSAYANSVERYFGGDGAFDIWATVPRDAIKMVLETRLGDSSSWVTVRNYNGLGIKGYRNMMRGSSIFGGYVSQTSNVWCWRLTFWTQPESGDGGSLSTLSTSSRQVIHSIRYYSSMAYLFANNLMTNNHLYKWDTSQNATFPAKVTAPTLTTDELTVNDELTINSAEGDHLSLDLASSNSGNPMLTLTSSNDVVLRNVADPESSEDAANKNYVDTKVAATNTRVTKLEKRFETVVDSTAATLELGDGNTHRYIFTNTATKSVSLPAAPYDGETFEIVKCGTGALSVVYSNNRKIYNCASRSTVTSVGITASNVRKLTFTYSNTTALWYMTIQTLSAS